MSNTREVIVDVIGKIRSQKDMPDVELSDDKRVIDDLGFRSLDVAQLIAMLELELGVDPFAEGLPLTDVNTIGEVEQAYQNSIDKNA